MVSFSHLHLDQFFLLYEMLEICQFLLEYVISHQERDSSSHLSTSARSCPAFWLSLYLKSDCWRGLQSCSCHQLQMNFFSIWTSILVRWETQKNLMRFLSTYLSYWEGFPSGSAGKESACNVGDLGWIPGLGRSPGEEKGYPLQYSDLENSMDCIVHGVTKSWTWLSNFQGTEKMNSRVET